MGEKFYLAASDVNLYLATTIKELSKVQKTISPKLCKAYNPPTEVIIYIFGVKGPLDFNASPVSTYGRTTMRV